LNVDGNGSGGGGSGGGGHHSAIVRCMLISTKHLLRVGWRNFFPCRFVFKHHQYFAKNCVYSTNANNSYVHFYVDNSTNANGAFRTDRQTD
jgi:hypothetical protein